MPWHVRSACPGACLLPSFLRFGDTSPRLSCHDRRAHCDRERAEPASSSPRAGSEGACSRKRSDPERHLAASEAAPLHPRLPASDGAPQAPGIEALVEYLDTCVRVKELSRKSAINVWRIIAMTFKDACSAKVRALRVRSDNPAAGAGSPVGGRGRRAGIVHVHSGLDREGGGRRRRRVLLDASPSSRSCSRSCAPCMRKVTAPLVSSRCPMIGTSPVLSVGCSKGGAHAGRSLCERPDAQSDDVARPAGDRAHVACGSRDDPLKIKQRAGHATFSTTEGYIREAEALHVGFGDVFPPLPGTSSRELTTLRRHRKTRRSSGLDLSGRRRRMSERRSLNRQSNCQKMS